MQSVLMYSLHIFLSFSLEVAVPAVTFHPHTSGQHQERVKECSKEDVMYSDFDMPHSALTEVEAKPHSHCNVNKPERIISPVSLEGNMTSKYQTPRVITSAEPVGRSRGLADSLRCCEESPKKGCSTGNSGTVDVCYEDDWKGDRVNKVGTAEECVEPYYPQPKATMSTSAGKEMAEDLDAAMFSDSLQTPRFLQKTYGSLDLDEPTLIELPTMPTSDLALNNGKHRNNASNEDEAPLSDSFEIVKEQSSLGLSADMRSLQFSNTDSQDSYKQSDETTKTEHSSLELNVNCCSSSQESNDDRITFNDSLLTPSFPSSELSNWDEWGKTSQKAQMCRTEKQKTPSILHSQSEKNFFIDDLHTPVFLKNVLGDSSSAENI